jgi:hypothetical protein
MQLGRTVEADLPPAELRRARAADDAVAGRRCRDARERGRYRVGRRRGFRDADVRKEALFAGGGAGVARVDGQRVARARGVGSLRYVDSGGGAACGQRDAEEEPRTSDEGSRVTADDADGVRNDAYAVRNDALAVWNGAYAVWNGAYAVWDGAYVVPDEDHVLGNGVYAIRDEHHALRNDEHAVRDEDYALGNGVGLLRSEAHVVRDRP